MRKTIEQRTGLLLAALLCLLYPAAAQDKDAELLLKLAYFNTDNAVASLKVTALEKSDGKLSPVSRLPVTLYLNDTASADCIGQVITDAAGKATAYIPAALQLVYKQGDQLHFIAVSRPYHGFDAHTTDMDIIKARLQLDTIAGDDGARTIVATLLQQVNGVFTPVKDADVKIGVQRMASFLPVGEEEAYTTDSLGKAVAAFGVAGLPGDEKGKLVLTARVEDNDLYGNLSMGKSVPWGAVKKQDAFGYGNRAMWATNNKAPLALQLVAYTLIVLVWGIIFYLVLQLLKIRRLGKAAAFTD